MLPAMLQIDGKVMKITSLYQSNRVCVWVCVCLFVCLFVCVCRVCRVCVCASCKTWRSRLRAMALGSTESLGDDLINRDFIKLYQTKKTTAGNSLINYINLIYSYSFTLCTLQICEFSWMLGFQPPLLPSLAISMTSQASPNWTSWNSDLSPWYASLGEFSESCSYCICCNDIKCISSAPTRSD